MEKWIQKIALWLEKLRRAPVIGSLVEDLITMTELLTDWLRGVYKGLPRGTVLGITAALFYAFCPIDLILDVIPFAGFLDDAAVIGLLLELGLARDLMQYRDWRRARLAEAADRYRRLLAEEYLKLLGDRELAAAYLTEDQQIKLLLSRPGDTARPLPCKAVCVPVDTEKLAELELTQWEDLGNFFSQLFRDTRFPWSRFGRQPFRPEYSCKIDDAFVIEE